MYKLGDQIDARGLRQLVGMAARRIRPLVRVTPLEYSAWLSDMLGCNVFLKLENMQITGSFKARGAASKLLSLRQDQRRNGVVTASTGNHALAVAHMAEKLSIGATIFLTEDAAPQKVAALRRYPVTLRFACLDCALTEQEARKEATRTGSVYISPYNDLEVIAGQGTVAVELERELGRVDYLFAAVGGGGLVSGSAGYLKGRRKAVQAVGCLPSNSPTMYECIRAGRIVAVPVYPTLSDATAGGIEPGSITFPLCQKLVDQWVLVSEEEIAEAIRSVFREHRLVVEGAAGVAVAGALKYLSAVHPPKEANAVVILCGGNIAVDRFQEIVCR
ncbi:MAG: threonine/serine dehydratase [candidate division KSB1 bacterium]|nr:threonine/serine dehydratase [candidate division KSB1 bacterium]MDZ7412540.1 threonine/serine dehydratase [candidate division KSB1 bacterium]